MDCCFLKPELKFSPYVSVEVMDAHLQNNQTAGDDILTSPDRLKGREHTRVRN